MFTTKSRAWAAWDRENTPCDISNEQETSGAVRSQDANHLDFTSIPLLGLIAVARTASEGAAKYGQFNYLQSLPVHDTLNHVLRHVTLYLLGDRSEPHLPHAAWGLLNAISEAALNPEANAAHLLSPGATIGPEMQERLKTEGAVLAAKRANGELDHVGEWSVEDLPEVKAILEARKQAG